jgi:Skp family chaperone for outer membrane proteins
MLKFLLPAAMVATTTLATTSSAHADGKIGILDMNAIFTQYHRTKDAESKLNEARAAAKTELDGRLETLKKAMDEINKLNVDLEKPELSKDAKDKASKARNQKIAEARNLDREIAEFRGTRERQLQEQSIRMSKDIIDDIMKIVNEQIKTAGYDVVLDKSGLSMGQVPVVIYSKAELDFSKSIIEALNKDAKPANP